MYRRDKFPDYFHVKKQRKNYHKEVRERIVSVCRFSELPESFTPMRGGFIPYCDGKFCFAVDARTGDLSDFAGGISYKKGRDECFLRGALRELREESLDVFKDYLPKNFSNTLVLYTNTTATIFVEIKCDMDEIVEKFREKVKNAVNPEVKDMVWLEINRIVKILERRDREYKFYGRPANLIKKIFLT